MKKKLNKSITLTAWLLSLMLLLSILPAAQVNAAGNKLKLSQTRITLTVGKTKKLTVKGATKKQQKKIIWSSSKKTVATVNNSGSVKAKKAGKTNIIAKIGKKKLSCTVIVKKGSRSTSSSYGTDFWGYKFKHSNKYYKQKRTSIYKSLGITTATKPQYAAFLLAKWECDHVKYDDNTSLPGQSYQQALDKGYVVCGGYANLYKFLLEGIHIPVKVITIPIHAWNHVKIDGKWYAVDVTFMDDDDHKDTPYDMTNFLVPDTYLGSNDGNSKGATDKRFVPVIYDSIVAFNKNFGGIINEDGDLERNYEIDENSSMTEHATNYLQYWDSNKNFIGTLNGSGEFAEPDYHFNPWFTGKWQSY